MADSFRMDMSGSKSYREDTLDTAMDVFGVNTRSKAVILACDHARQDKQAKERAIAYLVEHADPEHAAAIITRLATPQLPIETTVEIDTDGNIASAVHLGEDT